MTNHFAVLGLPESLSVEAAEVDAAWQTHTREIASREMPEDTEIHLARAVLSEPVSRLEHWLELKEVELERGSSMEPDFMDLFSKIHAALESADSVYLRHQKATTALGKALLSKEAVEAQLSVQECLSTIHGKKRERIDRFPDFENEADQGHFVNASSALGQLKFLRKWEQQCQERLLQLIEC
ncbi:MAG: hypothetical protein AAGF67_10845 [Verrucomicrobiota bacterium]